MLFDEPTSALDPELVGSVLEVMRGLRECGHDHDRGQPRDGFRPQRRRPRGLHGRRADRRAGPAGRDLRERRRRSAPAPSSARSRGTDQAMVSCTWDRFVETFFNGKVMAKYLPDILSRRRRHHRARRADRGERPAGRAGAGAAAQPRRPAAQLADRLRRRPVPLAAAAGHHRADLFRPAGGRHLALGLRLDLAVARLRADGLLRGDLLGRHHLGAEGAMGGGALDRPLVRPDPDERRAAAGARLTIPPLTNRTIAITKGTALGSVVAVTEILGAGELGGVELLQSLAADDGRGGLSRAVPARSSSRRAGSRPGSRGSDDRDLPQPRDHRRRLAHRAGGPARTPSCCR